MLCNSFSWNTQRFNLKNWWAFKLLGGIFMPTAGLLLVWKQITEEVQGDRWSYRKNGTTATSCCSWYKKIGEGRNERGGEKRHCNSLSPNQADERWQPQSLGARITILSLCLSSSHTHTHTPQDAGHYAEELAVRPCSHIHFKNTAISAAQYFIAVRDKPDYWPRLDQ